MRGKVDIWIILHNLFASVIDLVDLKLDLHSYPYMSCIFFYGGSNHIINIVELKFVVLPFTGTLTRIDIIYIIVYSIAYTLAGTYCNSATTS